MIIWLVIALPFALALIAAIVTLLRVRRFKLRVDLEIEQADARVQRVTEKLETISQKSKATRFVRLVAFPVLFATAAPFISKLAAGVLLPLFSCLLGAFATPLNVTKNIDRGVSITWSMKTELKVNTDNSERDPTRRSDD